MLPDLIGMATGSIFKSTLWVHQPPLTFAQKTNELVSSEETTLTPVEDMVLESSIIWSLDNSRANLSCTTKTPQRILTTKIHQLRHAWKTSPVGRTAEMELSQKDSEMSGGITSKQQIMFWLVLRWAR
jgi:hypothetical protein